MRHTCICDVLFLQFFPLGFYGVLTRHGHYAVSAQGGVLRNLGPGPNTLIGPITEPSIYWNALYKERRGYSFVQLIGRLNSRESLTPKLCVAGGLRSNYKAVMDYF